MSCIMSHSSITYLFPRHYIPPLYRRHHFTACSTRVPTLDRNDIVDGGFLNVAKIASARVSSTIPLHVAGPFLKYLDKKTVGIEYYLDVHVAYMH